MAPETFERILVAETDFGVRKQLHRRLLDANLFSDCVDNARAAMAHLQEKRYGVMVLELALAHGGNDQSGSERLLEYLQLMPPEDRPVVLALADAGSTRSLDVEVVQIVLRKPYDLGHLADLIQSCVKTAAMHRAASRPGRHERNRNA